MGRHSLTLKNFIWAAGLFEGEGSLYFSRNFWTVRVSMTDLDIVERFAAIWDLNLNKRSARMLNNSPSTIRRKAAQVSSSEMKTQWYAQTGARDKVFQIVCDIYPYLGERRREKCDEFLQWYAAKTGKRYD